MAKTVEFKTLDDVHKAFVCWESQGNAEEFARTVLQTAAHVVGESKGKIYDKDRLAREVFLTLLQYGSLAACLTDDFRHLVIRYHARGTVHHFCDPSDSRRRFHARYNPVLAVEISLCLWERDHQKLSRVASELSQTLASALARKEVWGVLAR